jgi:type IV secretory pathway VirB9-like protein
MYADNLGRIPPNTALMVITAGKKKYEIRLASTEQKTAAVKFIYQPSQ